ncbi:hypothetical protein GIB67_005822 [Kingdonia uniflora]|uniref:Uncharacterized protein n=1 Tax=Kingdonia uniflora TaxID=39325 RepID=A0A7J7LUE0_9MAGN|nr:hypothetical protein GIB67_005822 [Kingdonia uniflora]
MLPHVNWCSCLFLGCLFSSLCSRILQVFILIMQFSGRILFVRLRSIWQIFRNVDIS